MENRICYWIQNGTLLQNSLDVNSHMVLIFIKHAVSSDLYLSF